MLLSQDTGTCKRYSIAPSPRSIYESGVVTGATLSDGREDVSPPETAPSSTTGNCPARANFFAPCDAVFAWDCPVSGNPIKAGESVVIRMVVSKELTSTRASGLQKTIVMMGHRGRTNNWPHYQNREAWQ